VTRAQLRVLFALAQRSFGTPSRTSNRTKFGRVSGSAAFALIRRGLVERVIPRWDGEGPQPPVQVRLTAAGLKALKEAQ
jgi:hypothetical protein